MTKKHFKGLAHAIASFKKMCDRNNEPLSKLQFDILIDRVAEFCQGANSNFQAGKFKSACLLWTEMNDV